MFLTLAVEDDQAPLLVAAAWLHDIGYAPGLKTTRLPSARRSTEGDQPALLGEFARSDGRSPR